MHKETRQEGGRRKEVLGEQREGEGRREEEENVRKPSEYCIERRNELTTFAHSCCNCGCSTV